MPRRSGFKIDEKRTHRDKMRVVVKLGKLKTYIGLGQRRITDKTANEIVQKAKEFCPRKGETSPTGYVATGRLRDSIKAERRDSGTVVIGSDVEYAPHVEFGVQHPGTTKRVAFVKEGRLHVIPTGVKAHRIPYPPPRAFMRQALMYAQKRFYREVGDIYTRYVRAACR